MNVGLHLRGVCILLHANIESIHGLACKRMDKYTVHVRRPP